jgi:hypothetical protein
VNYVTAITYICMTLSFIGDELYEAEWHGSLNPNVSVEQQVEKIIQEYVKELHIGSTDAEMCISTTSSFSRTIEQLYKHNSEERYVNRGPTPYNYFKSQIQRQTVTMDNSTNTEELEDLSCMTKNLQTHVHYSSIDEPLNRLSPNRGVMEKIAAHYQKKQAEKVNKYRARFEKAVLDVGDIASMKVDTKTRAATDLGWLPVMVTFVREVSENKYMYSLCTQHGYLEGEYQRNDIYLNKYLTAAILRINPMTRGFKHDLTISKASALYNMLGGASFCRCKTNCLVSSRCSCRQLGKLCVSKCHGQKKNGEPVNCQNCATEHHMYV